MAEHGDTARELLLWCEGPGDTLSLVWRSRGDILSQSTLLRSCWCVVWDWHQHRDSSVSTGREESSCFQADSFNLGFSSLFPLWGVAWSQAAAIFASLPLWSFVDPAGAPIDEAFHPEMLCFQNEGAASWILVQFCAVVEQVWSRGGMPFHSLTCYTESESNFINTLSLNLYIWAGCFLAQT